jgi:hypothetical protein
MHAATPLDPLCIHPILTRSHQNHVGEGQRRGTANRNEAGEVRRHQISLESVVTTPPTPRKGKALYTTVTTQGHR